MRNRNLFFAPPPGGPFYWSFQKKNIDWQSIPRKIPIDIYTFLCHSFILTRRYYIIGTSYHAMLFTYHFGQGHEELHKGAVSNLMPDQFLVDVAYSQY